MGVCFVAALLAMTSTAAHAAPPSYCAGGGAQLWQNLEVCGWPGPANTGPDMTQCPGGLQSQTGMTIKNANTVINCMNISGGIQVMAQNVTIKNSIVSFDGGGAGGTGVININDGASATVDHVELNGLDHTHACIWDEGVKGPSLPYSMLAENVNCHDVNDGIFSWWWSSDKNAGAGSDFQIQDSYFHDFTENAANGHIDGYQTEGAQNGLITHNTYLIARTPGDVTVSGGGIDSAIAIWDDYNQTTPTGLTAGHITVSNNLIAGGGFAAYAEDYSGPSGQATENVANSAVGGNSLTNISFLNNSFSTYLNSCVGSFGVWFYRGAWPPYYGGPDDLWNQGGSLRSGNILLETGQNIDRGGPTGCEGANTSPPAPSASTCDLNGDGSTNVSDVQLCVNQAIGSAACTSGDINKDGVCNVIDVQRDVNAALGGACVTQ